LPVRACGSSGLSLPILGVGCWAFGGGEYWGPQSQDDVEAVVRAGLEQGCHFFDTAESYNHGASEESLGAALRGIPRDQVLIGTKVSPSHVAPATLVAHCEASLRRLRTDYIDVYMVHWPITPHSIRHFAREAADLPSVAEAFSTLDRLRREGKIRHIGVSNFGRRQLTEALATGAPIVVNELPYSLLARAIEDDILPFCRDRGIGVLGYMSLLQGVLSDRYARLADLPEWRRRTRHFDSRSTPLSRHGTDGCETETAAALAAVRGVARRLGLTTADLALKWACAGEGITCSLCGARTAAALRENIRAVADPLPPAIREELRQLTEPLKRALGPSFDYYENPASDRTV
jgi:aryl-alcohol dehydrogenase-like predicted oxidoreductase